MPCVRPPRVKVRTTVIVCQLTSSTLPASLVATYSSVPLGCTSKWWDVAGKSIEPTTVPVSRLILKSLFAFVVVNSVLPSGEIAMGSGSPVTGIVAVCVPVAMSMTLMSSLN